MKRNTADGLFTKPSRLSTKYPPIVISLPQNPICFTSNLKNLSIEVSPQRHRGHRGGWFFPGSNPKGYENLVPTDCIENTQDLIWLSKARPIDLARIFHSSGQQQSASPFNGAWTLWQKLGGEENDDKSVCSTDSWRITGTLWIQSWRAWSWPCWNWHQLLRHLS